MKILEINKFNYLRRGAERHMLDVIDLFESEGRETAVFAMHHPENIPSKWDRFFVSQVGYNSGDSNAWQKLVGIGRIFWSFEARRNMRRLLKEFRPDVVHLHNIYHQISPSILGPLKRSGAKIVMTVHDYHLVSPDKDAYYESVGQRYWKFLFFKKYGFFKRLLLVAKMYLERAYDPYGKHVDAFIVPSRFVRDALIRGGMDAKKIVVIPHFIANDEDIESESLATESKHALYFGSLSEGKGIRELVRIFDTLEKPLVLAGSPEPGFDLPESPWVTFVGQLDREGIERSIREASCVVSGSRLPETFGLIALEAISFSKPFFGLKSGAYAEIVENGRNGLLTDDFQGLENALRGFFAGKMSFDTASIRKAAYADYGKKRYLERFDRIVKGIF